MASSNDPMSPAPRPAATAVDALKAAGQAAASNAATAALTALTTSTVNAANNAGKPGYKTTEFHTTLVAILIPSLMLGLKVLSIATVPWLAIPAVAIGTAISAASYNYMRSGAKGAALAAAAAAITAVAQSQGAAVPCSDPAAAGPK